MGDKNVDYEINEAESDKQFEIVYDESMEAYFVVDNPESSGVFSRIMNPQPVIGETVYSFCNNHIKVKNTVDRGDNILEIEFLFGPKKGETPMVKD